MSDTKIPTDEEIGQLIDVLFATLPSLASDLFGKEVPDVQLTKEKKSELVIELRDLITRLQRVEGLKQQFKQPAATSEEWRSRLDKVASELAPLAKVPEGIHFADNLRQTYLSFALSPMSIGFFNETNYMECLIDIDKICTRSFEVGRATVIDKLFDEVFGSKDFLPLVQSYLSRFKETCEHLEKMHPPLAKKDIEELIEIHGRVSGDFEKGIRMIVGLLKIIEGNKADYNEVSSQPLASNVQFVKKRFPQLVRDFDVVIRNSISHRLYFVRLSDETVEFRDRSDTVIVTFKDLLLKCKLFIASTTALALAPVIFMHRRWDNIWRYYNSN